MTKLHQRMMEELRLHNSSEETIRSYIEFVQRFAGYYRVFVRHWARLKSPDLMNAEQVRSYLLYLLEERKLSWPPIHVNRAALRFLYVRVLRQLWFDEEIQPPKRRPQLPTVLSTEEFACIDPVLDAQQSLDGELLVPFRTTEATGVHCGLSQLFQAGTGLG